ncbi:MAG: hypothetical protein ACI920_003112, partial [Saprospiraceae bacterium]
LLLSFYRSLTQMNHSLILLKEHLILLYICILVLEKIETSNRKAILFSF